MQSGKVCMSTWTMMARISEPFNCAKHASHMGVKCESTHELNKRDTIIVLGNSKHESQFLMAQEKIRAITRSIIT